MKRSYISLSASLLLIISSVFTSCKKSDDVSVTRALIDDWKLSKIGLDINKNGLLDTAERSAFFDINYEAMTITFNEDKTGTSVVKAYYYPTIFGNGNFQWHSDDRAQMITVNSREGTSHTTKLIFIDFNTIAVLDNSLAVYGQSIWNVYTRK